LGIFLRFCNDDSPEINSQPNLHRNDQTFLYDHGKPAVAIWGLGFPDQPYNIRNIRIDKLSEPIPGRPVAAQ